MLLFKKTYLIAKYISFYKFINFIHLITFLLRLKRFFKNSTKLWLRSRKKSFLLRRKFKKFKKFRHCIILRKSFKFFSKSWFCKNLIFFKIKLSSWKTRVNMRKFILFRASWRELSRKGKKRGKKKILKKLRKVKYLDLQKRRLKIRKFNRKLNSSLSRKGKKIFFYKLKVKKQMIKKRRLRFKKRKFSKAKKRKLERSFKYSKHFYRSLLKNRLLLRNFFKRLGTQSKITKFVKMQSKFNSVDKLNSFELTLFNVLLKVKFSNFLRDVAAFIKNGFVFVNGLVNSNSMHILKPHDIVQLSIFKKMYLFLKGRLIVIGFKSNKIKGKVWRLKRNKFNFFKQRSWNIPKWAESFTYTRTKCPKYIEVDYRCLTCVILYKPIYLYEYNYLFKKFTSIRLLKLYNWKKLS